MRKQETQKSKTRISSVGMVLISVLIFGFTNLNAANEITPASIINETTNSRSILFNTPVPTGEITFLPVEQVVNNNEQLNQLLFGMNPYITINTEGVGQNSHETPVVAYCHNNAINSLYSGNESFKEVKVLRIYVDGAAYSDLDISQLENFDNLEYIVISFTYDACGNMSDSCLLTRTQNMIKAGNKPVTVLYQLSILQ